MKKQRGLVLTCSCGITAAVLAVEPGSAASSSSGDARQQVLDLGKEWVAAEVKHDAVTLARILDDKFLASFESKMPYTKAAFIKAITEDAVDPTESQTLTDESVIVDRDTAVVVGTDTVRGTENGSPYTVMYRYTVTYVHRNGRWLALAEHLVKVPQAQ
jgi:ketosteroid isomerase-like protein